MQKKRYFIKQFLKESKMVGAVSPSSKYLMQKMLSNINFKTATVIVEFGPGTGVFTRETVKRMRPDCLLLVFELNDSFYTKLREEFKHDSRIIIRNKSAEHISSVLKELNEYQADAVISSLPLANFPSELIQTILQQCKQVLSEKGKFIQFQYSLTSKKYLQQYFNSVQINFTARNIPPAFIYTCSNATKIS